LGGTEGKSPNCSQRSVFTGFSFLFAVACCPSRAGASRATFHRISQQSAVNFYNIPNILKLKKSSALHYLLALKAKIHIFAPNSPIKKTG
jgi:hypothetical protein